MAGAEGELDDGAAPTLIVLVPGYGGPIGVVEPWRMRVAIATLAAHGGGSLVVSGYGGEAERLAALAPAEVEVIVEPTARSTFENVERSLPFLSEAPAIAIASDRGHRRRAASYLHSLRPDLAARLVEPAYTWRSGWWMDAAGGLYEGQLAVRTAISERRSARATEPPAPT